MSPFLLSPFLSFFVPFCLSVPFLSLSPFCLCPLFVSVPFLSLFVCVPFLSFCALGVPFFRVACKRLFAVIFVPLCCELCILFLAWQAA
jgi:hypothetical protein